MILQTRASTFCDLLATESKETSHLEDVRDALILANATAFIAPRDDLVSNDRTTRTHQKR